MQRRGAGREGGGAHRPGAAPPPVGQTHPPGGRPLESLPPGGGPRVVHPRGAPAPVLPAGVPVEPAYLPTVMEEEGDQLTGTMVAPANKPIENMADQMTTYMTTGIGTQTSVCIEPIPSVLRRDGAARIHTLPSTFHSSVYTSVTDPRDCGDNLAGGKWPAGRPFGSRG